MPEVRREVRNIGRNTATRNKIERMLLKADRPLQYSEIREGLKGYRQPTTNQLAAILGQYGYFVRLATIPVASTLSGSHREGLYCLKQDVSRFSENLPDGAMLVIEKEVITNE